MPKPADRDEWLAERRPYFNASAAAVLFDRHPYQSPGDYATVKLTGVEPAQTRAMRRGIRLEDVIANWWADEHADEVIEPDVLYIAGPVMATADRWCLGDDCPVEIKTTAMRAYEPEPYWLYQCQAIMLCTGADGMWLVWFDPSMDIHERWIDELPNVQADIVERADRFMAAIELGMVPDWIELSYDNVVALHPDPAGTVELGDDGLDLVRRLDAARRERLDAERDEKRVRSRLAVLLGDKEAGLWNGIEVVAFRATRPSMTFDRGMFEADHPDLYEKYLVPKAPSRRMMPRLEVGG